MLFTQNVNNLGGHQYLSPISDSELFSPMLDHSDIRLNFIIRYQNDYSKQIELIRYPIFRIIDRYHTYHKNYPELYGARYVANNN
jgi:hypothetical protein